MLLEEFSVAAESLAEDSAGKKHVFDVTLEIREVLS